MLNTTKLAFVGALAIFAHAAFAAGDPRAAPLAEDQYRERLSRRAVGGSPGAEVGFLSELRPR